MQTESHTENLALEHLRDWDHRAYRCELCQAEAKTTDMVITTCALVIGPMDIHAAHAFLTAAHAQLRNGTTYEDFVARVYATATTRSA